MISFACSALFRGDILCELRAHERVAEIGAAEGYASGFQDLKTHALSGWMLGAHPT
jgi:hypothetical protein